MKPFLGVLAFMLWASTPITPVRADDTLSTISRLLSRNSIICADFTQRKTLRALTRPLLSKGRVVFIAGKGILWRVRDPFPTQLLVNRDALIKWNDAGEPQPLGFEQSPIFGALVRVFMAMFTGEIGPLQENFETESDIGKSVWRLTLTPRDKGFAEIITRVHVTGGRFVDELRIKERHGDQTLIKFSNMNTTSCQLDNAEKGYFAR